MSAYLYAENVSPRDRFQQLELAMDNGNTALLTRGRSYTLTANELQRARQFAVMLDAASATAVPQVIARLPVQGTPVDGDVPVWSSAAAAFVLDTLGVPSLRFEQSTAALVTSRPHHASGPVSYSRGRVTADSAVSGDANIVAIKVNGTTVATLAVADGQTSSLATIAVAANDGDAITITRLSTQGNGIVVELDNA